MTASPTPAPLPSSGAQPARVAPQHRATRPGVATARGGVRGAAARRHRLLLALLLVGTALLYLVGLSESGWANQFYAAAAQAGSKSWTAFLFGSLDSSNFITVDKPPAVAVGHGPVGPHLRPELVVDPGAAGAGGRRRGRAALRRGQAGGDADRGSAGRGDPGHHAGRDADVPLQQPGRAARAADDRRGLRDGARRRGGRGRAGWCWPARCSASRS